jgi:hypothetical protein
MNRVAPALFGLGIMIAISGGAKVPEKMGEWPDSWPVFLVGAIMALIGVVLWRRVKAAERRAVAAEQSGGEHDPFTYLADVLAPARTLGEEIGGLETHAICDRVDVLLETYILPLAEVRERVMDTLGMDRGAEVLITIAYGERMLNRVWSAAGDGHKPEALSVYPDALSALEEAQQLVDKARAAA